MMKVTVNGGTFNSVSGYAIEQCCTGKNGTPAELYPDSSIVVTGNIDAAVGMKENYYSQNNILSVISNGDAETV